MNIDLPTTGLGTSSASPTQSAAALPNNGMGKDEFLKLLTAQLENQDPMNPLQNHEFVAQLAQFSALEQQVLTNDSLGQIQMSQMGLANAQLAGFVGKEVVARGDYIHIDGGQAQPVGVELAAPASEVTITIKDETGGTVRVMTRANVGSGVQEIGWDGNDSTGQPLDDGRYTVSIEATDVQGNPVQASPLTKGIVDGITFENGYPELLVGLARIIPADIVTISDGDGSSSSPLPPDEEDTPTLPGGSSSFGAP